MYVRIVIKKLFSPAKGSCKNEKKMLVLFSSTYFKAYCIPWQENWCFIPSQQLRLSHSKTADI